MIELFIYGHNGNNKLFDSNSYKEQNEIEECLREKKAEGVVVEEETVKSIFEAINIQ